MTASQTLTPSQAKFIEETKARRARIARAAVPDIPIIPARSQPIEVPADMAPAIQAWTQSQTSTYQPWFSIVGEIDPPPIKPPSMGIIQRICAAFYCLELSGLLADRRMVHLVRARQVAMFLCKEFTTRSMPEIGRFFGGRDHTTVLHAVRKITRLESTDEKLAEELAVLRQRIREAAHD